MFDKSNLKSQPCKISICLGFSVSTTNRFNPTRRQVKCLLAPTANFQEFSGKFKWGQELKKSATKLERLCEVNCGLSDHTLGWSTIASSKDIAIENSSLLRRLKIPVNSKRSPMSSVPMNGES